MGGCCCSSRKPQLQAQFHGAPLYYYYPHSEEHKSLTSRDGVATILSSSSSSGLLIDLNMNMSIPDIYRSPPAPIPYDVVLGQPQSTVSEFCGSFGKKPNCMDLEDENCKNHLGGRLRNVEFGLIKSDSFSVSETNNKDSCPTCLEEYDAENPKIMTKCNHHFHLTCILEWMERSDTCPICDQFVGLGDKVSPTDIEEGMRVGEHWQLLVVISAKAEVVWFCSLHRKPDNRIKAVVQNAVTAYKVMGGMHTSRSKQTITWIYPKCNKQNGGWECGYYVMHWMSTIVRARIIDGWMEMFDDVAALTIESIRAIRIEWAKQFLEVRDRLCA